MKIIQLINIQVKIKLTRFLKINSWVLEVQLRYHIMCLNQEWVFWMLSNNHKKFSSLHCKNRHVYLESWIIYRRKHKINCSRFALNTKYLKNQQELKVLVWKNKSLNLMNLIKKEFKLITSIWNKISDLFFSILKPKEIFKSAKK